MAARRMVAALVCLAILSGAAPAADTDLKAAAKILVERNATSIVMLKVVRSIKATIRGREMPSKEEESEVLGTVLDETGVIVASNIAVDPTELQGGGPGFEIESEIKAVRLIRKDGTEVALKIVLRDKDLDLIFLRPEEPLDLPHVAIQEDGPEADITDPVIILSRLGPVGDRQPFVAIENVRAVVDKPRRFYVTSLGASSRALGCPVFNADGEMIGIMTIRVTRAGRVATLPVVLPVADIVEDMQQIEPPEEGDK